MCWGRGWLQGLAVPFSQGPGRALHPLGPVAEILWPWALLLPRVLAPGQDPTPFCCLSWKAGPALGCCLPAAPVLGVSHPCPPCCHSLASVSCPQCPHLIQSTIPPQTLYSLPGVLDPGPLQCTGHSSYEHPRPPLKDLPWLPTALRTKIPKFNGLQGP